MAYIRKIAIGLLSGLIGLSILPGNTIAARKDNSLSVAVPGAIRSLDGLMSSSRQSLIIQKLVDDTLLEIDSQTGKFLPLAAKSYKFLDPVTLEFTLQENRFFHDASPFTADDVLYTFRVLLNPKSRASAGSRIARWVKEVSKTGPMRVRIILKRPYPLALRDIALSIPMRKAGSYHSPTTGLLERHSQREKLNGLGPYRVKSYSRPNQLELEKVSGYPETGPKGGATLKRIHLNRIRTARARLNALKAGDVDWAMGMTPGFIRTQLPPGMPGRVNHAVGPDVRIGFLNLNAQPSNKPENPFAKLDVRRAVNHAINREALARDYVGYGATAIHTACHPKQFGCPGNVTRYEYNPAFATKLLVRAGYSDGFEFTLWAYRDRQIADAISKDLEKVGINATVRMSSARNIRRQRLKGKIKAYFASWGSGGTYDAAAIGGSFWSLNADKNMAKDPIVAAHIAGAESVVRESRRLEAYQRAFGRIADQAYWVPLFTYPAHYVYAEGIDFTPPGDGVLRLFDVKWR